MANDRSVAVKISADASGFRRGAAEAESGLDRLSAKLREHRAEEIQQSRATRFFAMEIVNLGVVSRESAGELAALVGAFAVGGGIGVAVETVKLLAHAFTASRAESKKFVEESTKDIRELQKQVDDYIATLDKQTASQKLQHEQVDPLEQKRAQLNDVLIAKTDALSEAQSNLDAVRKHGSVQSKSDAQSLLDIRRAELKATQEEIDKTEILIQAKSTIIGQAGAKEDSTQFRALFEKVQEDFAKLVMAESIYRQDDLREWKRHYDQVTIETTKFLQDKFEAEERQALAEANLLAEQTRDYKKHYDEVTAQTTAALDEMFKQEDAEAKKLAHELSQAAKELGDAMGQNLAEVLKGSKSIEDALEGMLATLIKVATQMAVMQALSAGGPLGILGGLAIGAIGGAIGGLFGGGSNVQAGATTNHITINGSGLSARQTETAVVNALRSAQRRGRF